MATTWKAKLRAYGSYWPVIWLIAIISSVIGGPASIFTMFGLSGSIGGWSHTFIYTAMIVFAIYFMVNLVGLVATFMKHWAIGVLTFIILVVSWFIFALMCLVI